MCYDDQAQVPLPPGAKGAAKGEDLVLTSSDNNQFAAYLATPETTSGAYIVIYPDVRGLHRFYKDLAIRFAEVGITAIAIDYFGRTAGLTSRDEPFEFWPHVQQLNFNSFILDVHAAVDYLRAKFGAQIAPYVIGFCMGGSFTLMTGTEESFGFAGLVPFYAGLAREFGGHGTVLDNAGKVKYPVLGLFGGADQGIPEEQVKQLDANLDESGVSHNIVLYPGAPHSFFDRRAEEFADASQNAWERILTFVAPTR